MNKWSAYLFDYMLSSSFPIGKLNKPYLTNYDQSIRTCLFDQYEDRKKECKQTYQLTIIDIFFFIKQSANLFVYMISFSFPIGQLNKPYLTNHNCECEAVFGLNGPLYFSTSIIERRGKYILTTLQFLQRAKIILGHPKYEIILATLRQQYYTFLYCSLSSYCSLVLVVLCFFSLLHPKYVIILVLSH